MTCIIIKLNIAFLLIFVFFSNCTVKPIQLASSEKAGGILGADPGAVIELMDVSKEKSVGIRHTKKHTIFIIRKDPNSSDGVKIYYIGRDKKKGLGNLNINPLTKTVEGYNDIKNLLDKEHWGTDLYDIINHYHYSKEENLIITSENKTKYFALYETDNPDKKMESKQKFNSFLGRIIIEDKGSKKQVFIEEIDKKKLITKLKKNPIENYRAADIAKFIFKFTPDDLEECDLVPKQDITTVIKIDHIKKIKNFLDKHCELKTGEKRSLVYSGDVKKFLVLKVEYGVYIILYKSSGQPFIIFHELRFLKKDFDIKEEFEKKINLNNLK